MPCRPEQRTCGTWGGSLWRVSSHGERQGDQEHHCIRLQAALHTVTGCIAYGYRLHCLWLQAALHMGGGPAAVVSGRETRTDITAWMARMRVSTMPTRTWFPAPKACESSGEAPVQGEAQTCE